MFGKIKPNQTYCSTKLSARAIPAPKQLNPGVDVHPAGHGDGTSMKLKPSVSLGPKCNLILMHFLSQLVPLWPAVLEGQIQKKQIKLEF